MIAGTSSKLSGSFLQKYGVPMFGDNIGIRTGAKIIDDVTIDDNCRIGANCVVVKGMPPDTTAVSVPTRFIEADHELNNSPVCHDEM